MFNHINTQVYQLLEDIQAAGVTTNPRGFKCVQANLATLEIDPLYPIMNFEKRNFNFRYFAGELSWYLQKTPQIDFINKFSSFWKDICPHGVCNSNYGHILLQDHPSTSSYEGINQIEWVYKSLVKDKDSRQAIAFLSCPFYQRNDGTKDFVCTLYLNFFILKNTLYMKVQMRSNDIFFGLTYDAPWFSIVHQSMYMNLKKTYKDLKLGIYYHSADNIHYYERHFETVDEILDSKNHDPVKMELKYPMFYFEDDRMYITQEFENYKTDIIETVNRENVKDRLFWKEKMNSIIQFS